MGEENTLGQEFDFDTAIESIKSAAAELAKPEVQKTLSVIGKGASAVSAIQDAVKAVAIQDAVKAVALQNAVTGAGIQDAAKAVAIQDAVKAVVGGMVEQDWSTPDARERLSKILEAIRSAADKSKK